MADILSATARIEQKVYWKAGVKTEGAINDLSEISFNVNGLKGGGNNSEPRETAFPIMLKELEDRINCGTIQLPITALDTYAGSFIQIYHELIIEFTTSLCIDNPTINIPICSRPPFDPSSSTAQEGTPVPTAQPPHEEINAESDVPVVLMEEVHVLSESFVMGGTLSELRDLETEDNEAALFLRASQVTHRSPSIDNLLLDMDATISEIKLVENRTKDPAWLPILASATPSQYGTVINAVSIDFDKCTIAELMAEAMASKNNFHCGHAVEALKNVAEWNCAKVVKSLLPYCNDLAKNKDKILLVLSEWDQMVTRSAFEEALSQS